MTEAMRFNFKPSCSGLFSRARKERTRDSCPLSCLIVALIEDFDGLLKFPNVSGAIDFIFAATMTSQIVPSNANGGPLLRTIDYCPAGLESGPLGGFGGTDECGFSGIAKSKIGSPPRNEKCHHSRE